MTSVPKCESVTHIFRFVYVWSQWLGKKWQKRKHGGKQGKAEEVLAESWLIEEEEKMRWVEENEKRLCCV